MVHTKSVRVEIAVGELIDKITILEIKQARITDSAKMRNVQTELKSLTMACDAAVPDSQELRELTNQLKRINESLWDIEDKIRRCEQQQDFGPHFIELARSVYRSNDQRALLKRQINQLLGSQWSEEKEYVNYDR